jgi:hypothetical protein
MNKRFLTCLVGLAAIALLAIPGQSAEVPKPEFYGLYAVADGKLYGIDSHDSSLDEHRQPVRIARTENDFKAGGGTVAQVPVLPGSLNLLVFVKGSPLQAAAQLKLQQLSFVRRMTINENDRSYRQVYQPNTWVAATDFGYAGLGATAIELRFKPVKGEDEMVIAVPASPLKPGLYVLGDNFLFAVPPIDTAVSSRCIDAARAVGTFASWRTWPCTEAPASASAATTAPPSPTPGAQNVGGKAALGAGARATGFIVTGSEVPVFESADSMNVKAHLSSGTPAANAKGSFLGAPKEFALEEANGRTHIVYLQERRMKVGWVDSRQLSRFDYDCSCKLGCNPMDLSLRQGSSWTECFERARSSQTLSGRPSSNN